MRAGTRRRRLASIVALALVLVAGVGAWLMLTPTGEEQDRDTDHPYSVVAVQRRDLTVGTTLSGTLGYGDPRPIPVQASGIVTWLPRSGHKAERGSVLLRVDGRPVVLMYGRTPAYRALHAEGAVPDPVQAGSGTDDSAGAEDAGRGGASEQPTAGATASVGPDVRQLEEGLWALGYRGFTVDDLFTSGTAAAVKEWQSDLGVARTGVVELGDVVFLPGPIRLSSDADALGAALTPTAVQAQGLTRYVTVQVDGESDWTKAGTKVSVTLPDGRPAQGTVTAVRRSSSATDEGTGGSTVQIALDKGAPRSPTGSVEVTYVAQQRTQVLAVPVTALVALSGGGYAVQRASGRYVAVTPGLYADGMVEVTGGIGVGTKIRVPR